MFLREHFLPLSKRTMTGKGREKMENLGPLPPPRNYPQYREHYNSMYFLKLLSLQANIILGY